MIIDCISDLHGYYPKLEGGDLLIVAGDLTARDRPEEFEAFHNWLHEQKKYKKVVVIPGNHDGCFEKDLWGKNFAGLQSGLVEYLCDSGTEFEGLKIWGSPWTKRFKGMNPACMAFTCSTEEELAEKWAMIPNDTDILVTHGPPYGFRDTVENYETGKLESVGSPTLAAVVRKINPKLHIFGHVHEGHGHARMWFDIPPPPYPEEGMQLYTTELYNVSHVNEHYKPVNKPVRVIL